MHKYQRKACFYCLILFFALAGNLLFALNAGDILILHSYDSTYDWTHQQEDGILKAIKEEFSVFNPIIESMDWKRFPNEKYLELLKKHYLFKYKDRKIKLIVTTDNAAFDFALKERKQLFSDAPIVFTGYNGYDPVKMSKYRNITGIIEEINVRKNLDLIFKLHPQAKSIYVLGDDTESTLANLQKFESEMGPYLKKAKFIFWMGRPFQEMLLDIKKLGQDSVIIFLNYTREMRKGQVIYYNRNESLNSVCQASVAPVYSFWTFGLGFGFVGGYLLDGFLHGYQAGKIAVRLMQGESIDNIKPIEDKSFPRFDYNVLKRFSISKKKLPEKSIINNEPVYQFAQITIIWVIVFLCLLIGAFILLTLFYVRLKKSNLRQKRMQLYLAKEKNQARRYLDVAGVMILALNERGEITLLNKKGCEILDCETKDVLGKNLLSLFADENSNGVLKQEFEKMLLGHSKPMAFFEYEIKTTKGKRLIAFHNSVIRGLNGNVRGVVSSGLDITKERNAEKVLRENEEIYRILSGLTTDSASSLSILPDGKFKRDWIVGHLAEKLGYTPEDIDSFQKWEKIVYSEDVACFRENVAKIFKGEKVSADLRIVSKKGEILWINNTIYPRIDEKTGKIIGIISAIKEITHRKQQEELILKAKELAESASRAKSEFLANMTHEIRTPITAIIGMADLLQMFTSLTQEQKEYLDVIKSSSKGLVDIINDILEISKIESDRLPIHEEEFNFKFFIHDLLKYFEINAKNKNLGFAHMISQEIPENLIGDSPRLRQILVHLAGNALKFTEKGEVFIEAEVLRKLENAIELQFKIKDTGIGIPENKKDYVFESFTQVDSSSTRKYGGTGLGLAVSKKFIEKMGGGISLESQLGKGSTFTFTVILKTVLPRDNS